MEEKDEADPFYSDERSLNALHDRLRPLEEFYQKYQLAFYKVGFWGFVARTIWKLLL